VGLDLRAAGGPRAYTKIAGLATGRKTRLASASGLHYCRCMRRSNHASFWWRSVLYKPVYTETPGEKWCNRHNENDTGRYFSKRLSCSAIRSINKRISWEKFLIVKNILRSNRNFSVGNVKQNSVINYNASAKWFYFFENNNDLHFGTCPCNFCCYISAVVYTNTLFTKFFY